MKVFATAVLLSLTSGLTSAASAVCTKPIALIPPASYLSGDISRSRQPQLDTVVVTKLLSTMGCTVLPPTAAQRAGTPASHSLSLFEGRADHHIPRGYAGIWLRNKVYSFIAFSKKTAGQVSSLADLASFAQSGNIKLGLHPGNRYGLTLRRLYRRYGIPHHIVFNHSQERRIRLLMEGKVDLIYDDLIHAYRIHTALGSVTALRDLSLFTRIEPVFLITPQPTDPELARLLEKLAARPEQLKARYRKELRAIIPEPQAQRRLFPLITSPQARR